MQIPLATEEEEEAVVAVKEKSVSSSPRHYSTDLQTLKSVVEGIQDVCRDAAAREGKAGDAGADGAEDEEGGGPWGLSSHDAVLRIMDAVREVSGIISETISASERAAEAPPLAWPTSLFSLLFTLRYSTTAESLGLATRRFLVSGETLSEDISRLTGAAWRLCSRPLLYDAETGRVQIPLATEEEEEAVVAVKEKSVSSSPRHYPPLLKHTHPPWT